MCAIYLFLSTVFYIKKRHLNSATKSYMIAINPFLYPEMLSKQQEERGAIYQNDR